MAGLPDTAGTAHWTVSVEMSSNTPQWWFVVVTFPFSTPFIARIHGGGLAGLENKFCRPNHRVEISPATLHASPPEWIIAMKPRGLLILASLGTLLSPD
ncbi:uncharacterized protein LDX57_009761 [Aspergillus melleus]|uniref:uncharacterized protein n=1 Tax=Aspergillus melleus TaxID=138277 RepID=UPI001E8CA548|nr:uncharacterized protein LDX57_009761 [Aspergillus melleus]KAH8432115.1 hypothetical protein LDX57_009761 [Aspergillus melleus]